MIRPVHSAPSDAYTQTFRSELASRHRSIQYLGNAYPQLQAASRVVGIPDGSALGLLVFAPVRRHCFDAE